MRDEVYELVVRKIAEFTGKDVSELNEETNVKNEIRLKSIELAAITAELEEEFDAYVKYTALMHANTIGEMTDISLKEIEG